MADDVTLPGTGLAVATDDVGGKHYQRLKLDIGGDGLSVPWEGVLRRTLTDRSGTITTGGTAQQAAAANAARSYLLIQNTGTGVLWFRFGGTAAASQPSFKLEVGASFEMSAVVSTEAISIFGATTGQAFSAVEA